MAKWATRRQIRRSSPTNFPASGNTLYDRAVVSPPRRPGLVKTKQLPLVSRQSRTFARSADHHWQELFEKADVVSEGAIRSEADGPVYYGSTSILLPNRLHGGGYEPEEQPELLALLTVDPHARVRVVRMACLEAQLRARHPIGSVRAEVVIRDDPRGVRVDIDVEANVVAEPGVRKASRPPLHIKGSVGRS